MTFNIQQNDIQQNGIQQNDIQQNCSQQNDIQQNDIQQIGIQQNDMQQNDNQQNDNEHITKNTMTFIMLSVVAPIIASPQTKIKFLTPKIFYRPDMDKLLPIEIGLEQAPFVFFN